MRSVEALYDEPFIHTISRDGLRFMISDQPFKFQLKIDGRIYDFRLPLGMIFDGASVPRELWGFDQPFGTHWRAAAIHDCGYRFGGLWLSTGGLFQMLKIEVDKTFRSVMRMNGVTGLQDEIEYEAVEHFAGSVWDRYRTGDPKDQSKPENWKFLDAYL